MQKPSYLMLVIAGIGLPLAWWGWLQSNKSSATTSANVSSDQSNSEISGDTYVSKQDGKAAKANELNAKRVFTYLEKICAIGSRTTGTRGMIRQQQMLEEHFKGLGATILWQPFEHRHPETGAKVEIKNMVVQWSPEKPRRVLLCTHYDTKPFPSMDPKNPKGLFVGANDGGSGTALFMELGHIFQGLQLDVGVDLIFFDAEELIYDERRDPFFLGSTYFAQSYVNAPTSPRYLKGILVDMIGDKDLQIYYEQNSFSLARPLVEEVWDIAKRLKIKEFEPSLKHEVRDDHLVLNKTAGIPVIDLIDFDYPRGATRASSYWHTMADRPDKCSGESMVKVGRVLLEWVKQQK